MDQQAILKIIVFWQAKMQNKTQQHSKTYHSFFRLTLPPA